jgi:hypothetical protein
MSQSFLEEQLKRIREMTEALSRLRQHPVEVDEARTAVAETRHTARSRRTPIRGHAAHDSPRRRRR